MSRGPIGGYPPAVANAEQGVPALRPGSLRSPGLHSVPPCSTDSTKGGCKLNDAPSQRTPLGDIVRESRCPLTASTGIHQAEAALAYTRPRSIGVRTTPPAG